MKQINYIVKNLFLLLLIIVGVGIFVRCNDAKHDELPTHAYIQDALGGEGIVLTIPSTGSVEKSLNVYISEAVGTDNHYTLTANQAVLDEYNSKNGTNYILLPASSYTLPEDIIIKAGTIAAEGVTVSIKAFTDEMTASGESYALPLKLVAKDGSISAMNVTGSYVFVANSVFQFSTPMFTNAASLQADGFPTSPETYGEYTVEVRFQVSNTDNRDRAIFKNGGDDMSFILLRFEDPQSFDGEHKAHSLVQVVGRNRIYLNPKYSFESNKWQHLALTCDGSNYRLYINGQDGGVKEIPAGPTTFSDINWFTGGDGAGDPWRNAKILMSEARIWSVCRTQLQIQNNMTKTSPKAPGLKAYWHFNEGGGNVFEDATGNGHTLRTTKTPQWIHGVESTDIATVWPN